VGLFALLTLLLTAGIPSFAQAYEVGDPVDDFLLLDADGREVALFDYQGWVVLLAFWNAG
jgi:hypothetical protein